MDNSSEFLKKWAEDIRASSGVSVDAERLDLIAAEISRLTAENADLRSGGYLARVVEERDRMREALRPFADVADFMDSETEGFSMTDCLQLVVQNEGFPTVHVESFCLQRFYTARELVAGSSPCSTTGDAE